MSARSPSEQKLGRMAPLARLPLFFDLHGKRAIVAGGSAAAAWKLELLSAVGACVDVYAESASEEMQSLAASSPSTRFHSRRCSEQDFAGASIAVGAFE